MTDHLTTEAEREKICNIGLSYFSNCVVVSGSIGEHSREKELILETFIVSLFVSLFELRSREGGRFLVDPPALS